MTLNVLYTSKVISVGHADRMAALIAHVVRGASRLRAERRANRLRPAGARHNGPWREGTGVASTQFRAPPRLGEPGGQAVGQPVGRDSHLFEAVAVAQRHGAVLQRLAVDSDSPGGADLILAPVAAPDRAALVVLGWNRA